MAAAHCWKTASPCKLLLAVMCSEQRRVPLSQPCCTSSCVCHAACRFFVFLQQQVAPVLSAGLFSACCHCSAGCCCYLACNQRPLSLDVPAFQLLPDCFNACPEQVLQKALPTYDIGMFEQNAMVYLLMQHEHLLYKTYFEHSYCFNCWFKDLDSPKIIPPAFVVHFAGKCCMLLMSDLTLCYTGIKLQVRA